MKAVIYVHDEALSPDETYGSAVPLFYAFAFLTRSREAGTELTFTARGPDAEEALEELKSCIDSPPTGMEAKAGARAAVFSGGVVRQAYWDMKLNGGRPSPKPEANPAGTVMMSKKEFGEQVEAKKREHLRRWGLLEAYKEMQAARKPRPPRSAPVPNGMLNGISGRGSLESFNSAPWKGSPWKGSPWKGSPWK